MARTVDTSSTLEDFRQSYNGLAEEIGGLSDLRTSNKTSIINAINSIQDQFFFFQDHEFDGSDGASSNTVFSGADNFGVTLKYSVNRLLVFKNGTLLRRGTEFTATNGTSVTLTSSAANSDIIRIVTYTGSYEGVSAAVTGQSGANNLISAGGALHNNNSGGFVINGDSNTIQIPTVSNSIEFNGSNGVFFNDNIFVNAESSSPNEIRFRDADNSNYVALKAANTIGSNVSFVLPSSDGSNGHVLKTDGSGNLDWVDQSSGGASAINDLSDVTITTPSSGQVLKYNGSAWVNGTDAGGIALTDLSVTTGSASGGGTLTYNNGTGVFSFAPADLSSYLTSISLDSLSAGVLDTSADSIAFIDADDSNASKKETVADFLTAIAGSGITVSGNQLTASGGGGGGTTYEEFKINYSTSGQISTISDTSSGISGVNIDSAAGGDITATFTGYTTPPLSVIFYGYGHLSNVYNINTLGSTGTTLRQVPGGGSAGSPTAFGSFSTLKLKVSESETGASRGFGTSTHAWVRFVMGA